MWHTIGKIRVHGEEVVNPSKGAVAKAGCASLSKFKPRGKDTYQ